MLGFIFHAHLLVRVDQMRGKERRGAGIAVPLCRLEAVQVVLGGHVKPAFLRGGGGPEVSESDFVDVQAWVHDNNLRCLSAPILFHGSRGCARGVLHTPPRVPFRVVCAGGALSYVEFIWSSFI
jgi:hypothetical protein